MFRATLLAAALFPMLAQAQTFDFNTVSDIALGQTFERLKQQYPEVVVPTQYENVGCFYIQISAIEHVQWMVLDGIVVRADLPATYKSPSLPVVSDFIAGQLTPEQAAARYTSLQIDDHEYHDGYRVTFFNARGERAVVADYVNDKVENLRVGLLPAAMFVEGCA